MSGSLIVIPTSNFTAEHIAAVNHSDYPGTRYVIWRPGVTGTLRILSNDLFREIYALFALPQVKGVIHGGDLTGDFYILYIENGTTVPLIEPGSPEVTAG